MSGAGCLQAEEVEHQTAGRYPRWVTGGRSRDTSLEAHRPGRNASLATETWSSWCLGGEARAPKGILRG